MAKFIICKPGHGSVTIQRGQGPTCQMFTLRPGDKALEVTAEEYSRFMEIMPEAIEDGDTFAATDAGVQNAAEQKAADWKKKLAGMKTGDLIKLVAKANEGLAEDQRMADPEKAKQPDLVAFMLPLVPQD